MDYGACYGDYIWTMDYYRDPLPHSLLSTRQPKDLRSVGVFDGFLVYLDLFTGPF